METQKYGTGALFIFPLIGDGAADFVTDYVPAAGDMKVWTDKLISTNPTSLILGFDSLSELPAEGAQIDENGAGTAEGIIEKIIIVSGTVGGGDAAGFFFMRSVTGQAWSNDDQIDINGGNTNIATADDTTYDLAATAGLIGEIGNGMFAAALSPTEMSCSLGQITIVDSATKAIEDQAIRFETFGNPSAAKAFDLDSARVNVGQWLDVSVSAGVGGDGLPASISLIDRNAYLIESLQSGHTWQGNYFYVDPVNGDTHANGNRGGRTDPYLTIQDCHDNAVTDSNHDTIFLVAGHASTATTHTVAATTTISKRYLSIRGPGRDFIITRTGNGDTLAVTADGVSMSGFQLGTAGTGSGHGIKVTDADFFKAEHIWPLDTRGDGIHILRGSNCIVTQNVFNGTGVGGSGQGVHIVGTAGVSSNNVISENVFSETAGDSILIEGGTTNDTQILRNLIHDSAGWGVNIGSSSTDAIVHGNIFGNNSSGNITDAGTTTLGHHNDDWASASEIALVATTADLLDKLGAVDEAAAAGDPSATESVMQYIKQIVNILAGTAGVVTFPAEAAPANGVSLAESIRAIHADVTGLAGAAMRGTNSAALATVCTEVRLATLTDWINGGRLDLILDAILAMLDAPRAEPGQGAPAVNADLASKIDYLFKAWRNKKTQTSTTFSLFDDAGSTVDQKQTVSDVAGTGTRGEFVTGP